jgi:hypothetical protein
MSTQNYCEFAIEFEGVKHTSTELGFDFLYIKDPHNPQNIQILLRFITQIPEFLLISTVNYAIYLRGDVINSGKMRLSSTKTSPNGTIEASFESLFTSKIQTNLAQTYSKKCNLNLFSDKCGALMQNFEKTLRLTNAIEPSTYAFEGAIEGSYYSSGRVKINNTYYPVKSILNNTITLHNPSNITIQTPINVKIYPYCDKQLSTCQNFFGNANNFSGIKS